MEHAKVLSDLVIKYQELVLVYQARERDYAMYSHRISKVFKRLASKANREDAEFAARCVGPAVDISMECYHDSQTAANSKLGEIEGLLEELARLSEQSYAAQSMLDKFSHALSRCVPSFLRL